MSDEVGVLVVDNHSTSRRGIVGVVNGCAGFHVVAEAGSADEALRAVEREKPRLAVAEVWAPGAKRLELVRTLRRRHPDVAILVLSQHPEENVGVACLKAGAHGFLEKGAPLGEVRLALRTVAAGRRYVSPALVEALLKGADLRKAAPHYALSSRELEVLDGLVRGISTAAMAAALGIRPKTVYTYRTRVFEKLGVRSDVELASYAIEHDLVPTGGARRGRRRPTSPPPHRPTAASSRWISDTARRTSASTPPPRSSSPIEEGSTSD